MKKVYQKPETEETIIEYTSMLALSNITSSTDDTEPITPYDDEDVIL